MLGSWRPFGHDGVDCVFVLSEGRKEKGEDADFFFSCSFPHYLPATIDQLLYFGAED